MSVGAAPAGLRPDGERVRPSGALAHAGVAPGSGFRPDIEGLRAVAVTSVVLYHAGVGAVGGGYVGVDVFFVISGFLITVQLVRELSARGTISIAGFYARRATRLLPASTLVVLVTLGAAWWWLPVRAAATAEDGLWTTVYGINYRLAREGVNYFGSRGVPPPLQHYWSLAVEEQFYLVWPVLLLAVAIVCRRRRQVMMRSIVAMLVGSSVVSLALCVWLTDRSAPWAYFAAPARAWELGLGALVALAATRLAGIPQRAAAAASWLGLAAVAAALVVFDDRTEFPGYAALLPVVGSALIIAGGCAAPAAGTQALLGRGVFQWIGKRSYGWYLWHWPVFVIAPSALGFEPDLWQKLALAAGSLTMAAISYTCVENPIRSRRSLKVRPWRAIALGASLSTATAVVAVLAVLLPPAVVGPGRAVDTAAQLASSPDPARQLAQLVAASAETQAVPANLTPKLQAADDDRPLLYADRCESARNEATGPCVYGDTAAATSIVLFGDSHAAHWFPALDRIARTNHWKLVVLTKSACSAASALVVHRTLKRPHHECVRWREQALERIRALHPAVVVMASSDLYGKPVGTTADPDQAWADAWLASIGRIKAEGTRLALIRDTPRLRVDVLDCVAAHLAEVRPCAQPLGTAFGEPRRSQLVADAAVRAGVHVIDPTSWFCTAATCPAVIGNVVVFRDGSHMSTAYSALLAPLLARQLDTVLADSSW